MTKRRPVRGTIQGVAIRSKVVDEALFKAGLDLTEAKEFAAHWEKEFRTWHTRAHECAERVENLQEVNRDLGRRLASEQTEHALTRTALSSTLQRETRTLERLAVYHCAGCWRLLGWAFGMGVRP